MNDNPFGLTPLWWFILGGIITGIGVNLLSAYLRDYLDKYKSKLSTRLAKLSEEKQLKRKAYIDDLVSSEEARNDHLAEEIRMRFQFTAWLVAIGIFLVLVLEGIQRNSKIEGLLIIGVVFVVLIVQVTIVGVSISDNRSLARIAKKKRKPPEGGSPNN